jgi:hypothetical protein
MKFVSRDNHFPKSPVDIHNGFDLSVPMCYLEIRGELLRLDHADSVHSLKDDLLSDLELYCTATTRHSCTYNHRLPLLKREYTSVGIFFTFILFSCCKECLLE